MANIIHGNDLLVLDIYGNAVVGCSKSCSISMNCEMLETAGTSSGKSRSYIPGRTDWSITIGYLVVSVVADVPKAGTQVSLRVRDRRGGSYLSGNAYVEQCDIDATRGNLCKGTFVFKGTGPLSVVEVSDALL